MKLGSMLADVARALFQKPNTELYPMEHRKTPPRARGMLQWNPTACTGCGLCAKDCPADALEVIVLDRKQKRFVMRYDLGRCAYCGQCVQSCRVDCLSMAQGEWELASSEPTSFQFAYGASNDVQEALAESAAEDTR